MTDTDTPTIGRREVLATIGGAAVLPRLSTEQVQAQSTEIEITFHAGGWNLIGVTDEVSVDDFKEEEINIRRFSGDYFWQLNDGGWETPETLKPGDAYLVQVGDDATTSWWPPWGADQVQYTMNEQIPALIRLTPNWNMISASHTVDADELEIAGVLDSIHYQDDELVWHYTPHNQWERSQQMTPGKGYYMYANESVVFVPTKWYQEVGKQIKTLQDPFTVNPQKQAEELSQELEDRSVNLFWEVAESLLTSGGGISQLGTIIEETAFAFSEVNNAGITLSTVTYRNGWKRNVNPHNTLYEELNEDYADSIPKRPVNVLFEEVVGPLVDVYSASTADERRTAITETLEQISTVQDIIRLVHPIDNVTFDHNEVKDALNKNIELYDQILTDLEEVLTTNRNQY